MEAEKLNQLPCGHAQMRRRRRRETVTRMSTARTRRCTENSQIPGKRKPNGTGRGFLQGHTRGAITPAPFVQTTSGCRATVPRTPRPGRPPPLVHDHPCLPRSASPSALATSCFSSYPLPCSLVGSHQRSRCSMFTKRPTQAHCIAHTGAGHGSTCPP